MTEQTIEQEIQTKGLTAPRLTPSHIDSVIVCEHYFTAADGVVGAYHNDDTVHAESAGVTYPTTLPLLTFCVLTLENGFKVTGESACASPENFDAEIGKKIARENAREKIWLLEGYLLKQRMYEQEQAAELAFDFSPEQLRRLAAHDALYKETLDTP